MEDELNPVVRDMVQEGRDLFDVPDYQDRYGGEETLNELIVCLRNSALMHNPNVLLAFGIEGAKLVETCIFTGFMAGCAAEKRAQRNDDLAKSFDPEFLQ